MKCARRWRRKVGGYTAKFQHRSEDVENLGGNHAKQSRRARAVFGVGLAKQPDVPLQ